MTSQDETKKFTQSDIDCTIKITDDQLSEQGRRAKRHTGIDTTDGFGDISSTRLLIRELSNLGGIVDLVRDVVSSDNAQQEECDLSVTGEQGGAGHFSPVATDLPNREDLPKLLQQYAPGNTFAAGGQGLLSQAKDLILKRPVALKSLRRELLDKPELVKAFITEALITAQLCHPAVVSIYNLLQDDENGIHLTMQLIQGRTLQERMASTSLPEAQKKVSRRAHLRKIKKRLELFRRICEPVAYAHSKGIIHCDLKPENIMLGKYGEVYVMDWGIARIIRDSKGNRIPNESRDTLLDGTPRYLPPEALAGVPRDERADIYALGLILFNMCTLNNCYDGTTQEVILRNIRTGVRNPVVHRYGKPISADLKAVIEKAIAHDPADRYQSVAELSDDVQRLLTDDAVKASPDSPLSWLLRFIRHNIRAFVILSLLVWLVALIVSGNALKESLLKSEQQVEYYHTNSVMQAADGFVLQNAVTLSGHMIAMAENLNSIAYAARLVNTSAHRPIQHVPQNARPYSAFAANSPPQYDSFMYQTADASEQKQLDHLLVQYASILPILCKSVIASEEDGRFNTIRELDHKLLSGGKYLVQRAYISLEENGLFLAYPASGILTSEYDCRQRTWYKDARENFSRGILTPQWEKPYQGSNSTDMVATCTIPLTDADNNFIGVCALDLDLTKFGNYIFAAKENDPPYILDKFLFDSDGTVVSHLQSRKLSSGRRMVRPGTLFQMMMYNRNPSGLGHFVIPNELISCHYAYLPNLDKYIMMTCDMAILAAVHGITL